MLSYLIMNPFLYQKFILFFIKIYLALFGGQILISNCVLFVFNKKYFKGGDGREILLNSRKEVISF